MIRKKADIEIIALDIKSKMWEDDIDVEAINGLIDKKYDIKKSKAKNLVAACAKLRSILSAKQRAKLKGIVKNAGKKKDCKNCMMHKKKMEMHK
ncbi:hypothetical protein ACFLTD_05070 [Elusimicrobiota bacterium]